MGVDTIKLYPSFDRRIVDGILVMEIISVDLHNMERF